MLSPVTRIGNASQSPLKQRLRVTTVLLLSTGCAQVAGFDDFKGASSGGNLTSTGGAGFNLQGGGTSLGGSTAKATTEIIFAGNTSLAGSNGTGGSSQLCGAATQACCAGDTCTASNTVCNTSHVCEACGALSGRCCQARTQCTNNGCCVSDKCVAAGQSCGGPSNLCQQGACQTCGKATQPCCGTSNGSCDYGLTCSSGDCG
jgi:hypothetical protein